MESFWHQRAVAAAIAEGQLPPLTRPRVLLRGAAGPAGQVKLKQPFIPENTPFLQPHRGRCSIPV